MRLSSARGSRLLVELALIVLVLVVVLVLETSVPPPKGTEDDPTLLTAIRDRFSLVFRV
jgi:hypothetical protein